MFTKKLLFSLMLLINFNTRAFICVGYNEGQGKWLYLPSGTQCCANPSASTCAPGSCDGAGNCVTLPIPCNMGYIPNTNIEVLQPGSPTGNLCGGGGKFLQNNCTPPFKNMSTPGPKEPSYSDNNCVYTNSDKCVFAQCLDNPKTAQFINICKKQASACDSTGTKNCCPGTSCLSCGFQNCCQ